MEDKNNNSDKAKNNKSGLENLKIYSNFINLIWYTNNILKKYPKSERFDLTEQIKNTTYDTLKIIITAQKSKYRIKYLNNIDTNLKFLLVLVRVSYKNKYISYQNYKAWSSKLNYISKLNIGWYESAKDY